MRFGFLFESVIERATAMNGAANGMVKKEDSLNKRRFILDLMQTLHCEQSRKFCLKPVHMTRTFTKWFAIGLTPSRPACLLSKR
jgi:hypothetical protein